MIQNRIEKKGRKLVTGFVDLKAAFESVDREVVIEAMRERGIRKGLVERVGELLKETKSRMKMRGKLGENFWKARRVRQSCPMLVWTILGYGMEVWRWKEREGMERLEERYMKWMLGMDNRTPGYMLKEELQREKLRGRAGRRAWEYEERLREGGGSALARMCLGEMREIFREGRVKSNWERERKCSWKREAGK